MSKRKNGMTLILLIAAVVGVITSFTLLKEDVLSTAKTLFEYFPSRYGVTPASTWEGAKFLGIFVTVTQIVAAGVAFRKELPVLIRLSAGFLLILSAPFDCWTDVVYRSGNFTGDTKVALITTIAFYTFGSEMMQSLSWLVIFMTWREGIREAMWVSARTWAGVSSIGTEWKSIRRISDNTEQKDIQDEITNQNRLMSTPQTQTHSLRQPNQPRPAPDDQNQTRRYQAEADFPLSLPRKRN